MNKTILTCAITGSGTRPEQTPYLPITPDQIATSALEAAEAGAAIVHLHVRDPSSGKPSMNLDLYCDTVDRIKKHNADLLINLTTGPGAFFVPTVDNWGYPSPASVVLSPEERVGHILKIRPDLCSLDLNTMHLANSGMLINARAVSRRMIELVQQAGTKPELEIFDSGDFRIAQEFIKDGTVTGQPFWQFAMGIKYGWDATPETLDYARRKLPIGSNWSAFGIGQMEMPMVAQTWLYGGHVRVGLEDNIYVSRGVLAKSNAELVIQAREIIRLLGGELASPHEARQIIIK
jgi:uncharacterized protein (DUF849 family)